MGSSPQQNQFLKHTRRPFAALLAAFLMLGATPPVQAEWHGATEALMGTRISVRLWHEDADLGEAAVRAAIDEIARIERLMSTYMEDSRISAINREAHLGPVPAGSELFGLIERAVKVSAMTDGRFDITYDSVGKHYDFRKGVKPDADTIARELENIDYRFVLLDKEDQTVAFKQEGVRINLGGIAKGYAVERAVGVVRDMGVAHASVTAGGDSRLLGDRRGQPWLVGIQDPRNEEDIAVIRLPLVDEAISTSGDYERYFDEGDVRYHHIIAPSTGTSANEVQSVTVVGPEGTMTDALSTSVFVLGVADGLALIEKMEGFDAVIIDADRTVHYSSGFDPANQ